MSLEMWGPMSETLYNKGLFVYIFCNKKKDK